ncbi:hypothetical protein AVEN_235992-1 [Araneus ventricosus]|uniref:Tc1-like transposase DDE domain-containing protein n=1 Tax=Araneus ventricosus TaxID=182803 RepID=A0A4Y2U999_ARAVE|nr:hypothetical protein AVEN_235992-1 [Araneus ventricosus]
MPICIRVWRQPHESMDPACQQGTVQGGGGSVMVWGVCNWRDMGPLIRLDTTLTGDRYVSILSGHLHPFMSIVYSDGLGEFQQDNATPHTSRIATEWLQEHSSDFRHFRWPPKSSDMNIIEHIWDCCSEEISFPSYSYGFMDSPSGFMVSITSSTTSDISRFHSTSCCGIHGVNYLQHYFRHQSIPCHVVLRHFCVLAGALHDIRQVYQFFWFFSVALIVSDIMGLKGCLHLGFHPPFLVFLKYLRKGKYEMTDSSPVWTPDLGDHFGDEVWDLKGAGIFSISLLGEKIRHECARSFHVTSRPAGGTI